MSTSSTNRRPESTRPVMPREDAQARTWAGVTELGLVTAQLEAVDAWLRAVTLLEAELSTSSPEQVALQHGRVAQLRAVTDSVKEHVLRTTRGDARALRARAVVAHRSAVLRKALAAGLQHAGVDVVAAVGDRASALGRAIAEQPDLLVVEDGRGGLSSDALLAEATRFAPRTVVAIQADAPRRAEDLRRAGAAPFARALPPDQVAQGLSAVIEAARARCALEG